VLFQSTCPIQKLGTTVKNGKVDYEMVALSRVPLQTEELFASWRAMAEVSQKP
jgi:hypothetical protein